MYQPESLPANRYLIDVRPCSARTLEFQSRYRERNAQSQKKLKKRDSRYAEHLFFTLLKNTIEIQNSGAAGTKIYQISISRKSFRLIHAKTASQL